MKRSLVAYVSEKISPSRLHKEGALLWTFIKTYIYLAGCVAAKNMNKHKLLEEYTNIKAFLYYQNKLFIISKKQTESQIQQTIY
jgi:hypothetical protein